MDKNSVISLLLFYTYRYYKRIDLTNMQKQIIFDITQCDKLLQYMDEASCSEICIETINNQLDRINSWGYDLQITTNSLTSTVRNENSYIIDIMKKINKDILHYSKKITFRIHINHITRLFMGIHNLPRVFVDENLSDPSASAIHMTASEAINCVIGYLGDKYV